MSFCPSCGAQNSDDARFCNKCGSKIASAAAAPAPGPPMSAPAAAPSATQTSGTQTSGTVTLTGIGIQSQGRAYAVLGAGAVLFLALGAGMAYIGMRSGGTPPPPTTGASTGTDDVTGDGVPDGVDVPDDDFVMTSGARVVKRGPSASTTGGTTPPTTGTGGATPPTTGTGGTAPPTTSTHGTTSHATTGGSTGAHTGTTGSTGSTPIDPPPSSTTSGSGTPPPSSTVDWGAMEGTVAPEDEPDYQMQMYSTQVRRFIRQYLLPQATSCFEHASATSRDPVRGTVAIGFDIDARGHAQRPTIDRNTTGNDALARCLQNNVGTWQLPPPPEGTAPIQMQMPFTR